MLSTKEAINLSKNKPVDEKKADEQAAFAEARLTKLQWLEHPVTKALIRQITSLEKEGIENAVRAKLARQDSDALTQLVCLEQLRVVKVIISSPEIIFGNAHNTDNS